jgi:putative phosphoesterase
VRDLSALDDALPVRAVCGNCDFFGISDLPDRRVEEIGGYRFFLTHGHRYGVKYSLEAAMLAAADAGADVLLYGHTHIPYEKTLAAGSRIGDITLAKPLLVLCPGSLGDADASFATLTVQRGGILAGFGKL